MKRILLFCLSICLFSTRVFSQTYPYVPMERDNTNVRTNHLLLDEMPSVPTFNLDIQTSLWSSRSYSVKKWSPWVKEKDNVIQIVSETLPHDLKQRVSKGVAGYVWIKPSSKQLRVYLPEKLREMSSNSTRELIVHLRGAPDFFPTDSRHLVLESMGAEIILSTLPNGHLHTQINCPSASETCHAGIENGLFRVRLSNESVFKHQSFTYQLNRWDHSSIVQKDMAIPMHIQTMIGGSTFSTNVTGSIGEYGNIKIKHPFKSNALFLSGLNVELWDKGKQYQSSPFNAWQDIHPTHFKNFYKDYHLSLEWFSDDFNRQFLAKLALYGPYVPEVYKKSILSVGTSNAACEGKYGKSMAHFSHNEKAIKFCPAKVSQMTFPVLMHEFAHALTEQIEMKNGDSILNEFSAVNQNEYEGIGFKKMKSGPQNGFFDDYAMANAWEDIAVTVERIYGELLLPRGQYESLVKNRSRKKEPPNVYQHKLMESFLSIEDD